jgi:hypothetical protein
MAALPKVLISAPELIVRVNGKTIGYASGLNWSQTQGQKMTFGVDSPFPQEISQGSAPSFVSGSMTVYRLKNSSPEEQGIIAPRTPGGTPIANTSIQGAAKYSVIELVDRQTKATILRFNGVMFASQSWSVQSRDIVQGVVSFQGITSTPVGDEGSFLPF